MSTTNNLMKWFKPITILAILWNAAGVIAFLAHVLISDEDIAQLPQEQRELFLNEPVWTNVTFAIAVFSGLIGSILLLLTKKSATALLTLSLIIGIAQFMYNIFIGNAIEVYGLNIIIMPILVIIVGSFLVWYSKKVI
jgi:hypothetical protein